jgi:hypothetical protein
VQWNFVALGIATGSLYGLFVGKARQLFPFRGATIVGKVVRIGLEVTTLVFAFIILSLVFGQGYMVLFGRMFVGSVMIISILVAFVSLIGAYRLLERIGTRFSPEVRAAIVGGTFALIVFVASETGVVRNISKAMRTRTVDIRASLTESGDATRGDSRINRFSDGKVMRIGDSEMDKEQRAFLVFPITDIPSSATIEDVTLVVPCRITGDISQLGRLLLNAAYFEGGALTEGGFNGLELNNNAQSFVYVADNDFLQNACKPDGTLRFGQRGLESDVQIQLQTKDWSIRFVLYFESFKPLSNGQVDVVEIQSIPILHVTYVE